MKALIVGWGYPPDIDGGLDIHVKELFEGLKEKDIEVTLALPEDRSPEKENIVGIPVEGDMMSKAEQMSRKVASMAQNYDIIHTHDWFGSEAGYKASKYSDIAWISTFHSLSCSRSRQPSKELEKFEEIGVKHSDVVTSVSKKLGDELKKKHSVTPKVIYNGFSSPKKSKEADFNLEKPVFFFVGRHAEQKGLEHLLYGFKKYLEHNEGLLVLGGKGHLTSSLKDFVEILGIDEHVRFEGFIPENELGGYYEAADVFVTPSINEPFGLTISEALKCGTPVVCADSGITEILPSGTVTLVDAHSDSIKEGLEKALDSETPNFEERSWSEMVEEYIELYERLV